LLFGASDSYRRSPARCTSCRQLGVAARHTRIPALAPAMGPVWARREPGVGPYQ
jgi:hypothetical protein